MIDLVYVLNRGSRWEDNELRFSLRSVHKHLANVGQVFVVGDKPRFDHWVKDFPAFHAAHLDPTRAQVLHHVPYSDRHANKERNIYEKVLYACSMQMISSPFLFMNDDHFLLADFDADTFPDFHKADLSSAASQLPAYHLYRQTLERTRETLVDLGLPTVNFDSHCPIRYDAARFARVMPQYDWSHPRAFAVKSLYANSLRLAGVPERDGKFGFVPTDQAMLREYIKDRKYFSVGDHAVNQELATFLLALYPEPSPWEVPT